MKIAVIAKTRLPIAEPFKGGLEAFTHSLCTAYLALGHQIILYAHADSDPALNVKSFYGAENRDSSEFELYENDEYLSILDDIDRNNFDVVHNNSTHELPIIWGVKAQIPVITTVHTPPTSKLKAAIKICSGAKNLHFVTPSASFQRTWQPYMNNGSTVIYNGVDLERWPMVKISSDYLFWFGRIVHVKGLDMVIEAAHELNMPLKFAGPLDDEQYFNKNIRPRMREGDTYLGHLAQAAIRSCMKGASAMVNAVRWEEPFGLTVIEAMSCGVPVAGFDRGAFCELVDQHSGVIAEQKNVRSLARAVEAAVLLDSDRVRKRAEKFSLINMASSYIHYFEPLL